MSQETTAADPGASRRDTILVLGASSDIGLEIIRQLAPQGPRILAHHNQSGAKLGSLERDASAASIVPLQADLSNPADIESLVARIKQLDPLPNKIVHLPAPALEYIRFKDTHWDDFQRVFRRAVAIAGDGAARRAAGHGQEKAGEGRRSSFELHALRSTRSHVSLRHGKVCPAGFGASTGRRVQLAAIEYQCRVPFDDGNGISAKDGRADGRDHGLAISLPARTPPAKTWPAPCDSCSPTSPITSPGRTCRSAAVACSNPDQHSERKRYSSAKIEVCARQAKQGRGA